MKTLRLACASIGAASFLIAAPAFAQGASGPVKIGLKNWDWTEITGGLAAGDEIVASLDRPEVKAGAKVKTVRQSAEAAAAASSAKSPSGAAAKP